jgi:two-component system nitrogen regulation response regulator NtrX
MTAEPPTILVVDDQRAIREELVFALGFEGYRCVEAVDGRSCLDAIGGGDVALVLLDIKMPGMDGLEVLAEIHKRWPDMPVVMISGHGDIETAVVALKNGAYDFLPKPFDTDRVLVSVKNALRFRSLTTENHELRRELAASYRLLGQSPAIREVQRLIDRTAPTDAQILITGENGTGKELVARLVHAESKRRRGPFVAVNCAAIPASLIESELFGHEKGAFTGATASRKGHFEAASSGILFLDEVGDMAIDAQAKLLRTLEDKTVTRIGSTRPVSVDVRVIAATNQDLEQRVADKHFREDLYYRLRVIPIRVPPLRERLEDVPELARHFLHESCRRNGQPARELDRSAIDYLKSLPWPGNVRELKNLIEAASILADDDSIDADALRSLARSHGPKGTGGDYFALPTLEEFRSAAEKEFIRRKLQENGGNIKRTAELIQIQRSNLYKKLERYGLK